MTSDEARLTPRRRGGIPTPTGGITRLRWWDGSDWTDDYRVRPTAYELAGRVAGREQRRATVAGGAACPTRWSSAERRCGRDDAEAIISEVRKVARSEVERAADLFSARARAATREIEPLITQYTTKFTRLLKVASFILAIALVGWFVFQFIVQQSFYDWLGDRIDNLTD